MDNRFSEFNKLDFIGDIHGHCDELEALLTKLGYKKIDGCYQHEVYKAFFCGDFIDSGPKIRETLQIVKNMVDNGHACAVMGNHEFNAICYNIPRGENFLREHSDKNIAQHQKTIDQFKSYQLELQDYLLWFRTLPLFFEGKSFRVVHACWDSEHIASISEKIKSYGSSKALPDDFFIEASDKSSRFYLIVEETLKGKEVQLPKGIEIEDKNGHKRSEIRIKWWLPQESQEWRTLSFHPYSQLPEGKVNVETKSSTYYREDEKPVFFGHYWCKGQPQILRANICCVDYSVAKNGKLVAYRFNGEQTLSNNNFEFVESL